MTEIVIKNLPAKLAERGYYWTDQVRSSLSVYAIIIPDGVYCEDCRNFHWQAELPDGSRYEIGTERVDRRFIWVGFHLCPPDMPPLFDVTSVKGGDAVRRSLLSLFDAAKRPLYRRS